MKSLNFVLFSFLMVGLFSCNNDITENDVIMDWETGKCVSKSDSTTVTATINFTYTDDSGNSWLGMRRTFVDGVLNGKAIDFYSDESMYVEKYYKNGKLDSISKSYDTLGKLEKTTTFEDDKKNGKEITYNANGKISIATNYINDLKHGEECEFYKNGTLKRRSHFVDNQMNGGVEYFNNGGKQSLLEIYENGKLIKTYQYDRDGNKIIPMTEKVDVVNVKTGFYEYIDYNAGQVLYQPIIMMKFKNTSDQPFKKSVKVKGVFINNMEEWSNDYDFLQSFSDTPLEPGFARQVKLQSNVGYTNYYGVTKSSIKCKVYINDEYYKTYTIKRQMTSNVM
ncbi:MAG: hypothetical protein JEZ09_21245 [Salinivirgaceae bacterium]|nr:hypothetical protein [Salinivirgaceae bacterium]